MTNSNLRNLYLDVDGSWKFRNDNKNTTIVVDSNYIYDCMKESQQYLNYFPNIIERKELMPTTGCTVSNNIIEFNLGDTLYRDYLQFKCKRERLDALVQACSTKELFSLKLDRITYGKCYITSIRETENNNKNTILVMVLLQCPV